MATKVERWVAMDGSEYKTEREAVVADTVRKTCNVACEQALWYARADALERCINIALAVATDELRPHCADGASQVASELRKLRQPL